MTDREAFHDKTQFQQFGGSFMKLYQFELCVCVCLLCQNDQTQIQIVGKSFMKLDTFELCVWLLFHQVAHLVELHIAKEISGKDVLKAFGISEAF